MATLKRGIYLGALTGAALSIAYTAVAILLVGALLVTSNASTGRTLEAIGGAGLFTVCAWPCAVPVGILPGIAIGAVGGAVIGLIVLPVKAHLTRAGTALIGLLVGIGIAAVAHILLYPGMVDETRADDIFKYLPYLFWIGLPSALICVGATWVGWKILSVPPDAESSRGSRSA